MQDRLNEVDSRREVPFTRTLNAELEAKERNLGSAEVDGTNFVASISDSVVGFSLEQLFADRGSPLPPDYKLYDSMYQLWVVPHRVGILRKSGLREVTSVGVEVRYEAGGKTCAILALLPESRFVRTGSLKLAAMVGTDGQIRASSSELGLGPTADEKLGLSVSVSGTAQASLAFEADVMTPAIQAIGVGTHEARWQFDQDKLPLYGRELAMWSVLLLPRRPRQKQLTYVIRAHITHRVFLFPTVWSSEETRVTCSLL